MTILKWREMVVNVFALIYILSKNKFKKILTAINNAVVIKNKPNKIQKFCVLQIAFFSLKFVVIVFVYSASMISSHLIIELSIILAEYLPFFQLHVARSQIFFFHMCDVFCTHIKIYRYPFLIWVTLSTIEFTFTFRYMLC